MLIKNFLPTNLLKIFLLKVFIFLAMPIFSQTFFVNFGLVLNCGTHLNRIGFFASGYYVRSNFQSSIYVRPVFNFKGIGTGLQFVELQINPGVALGFGRGDTLENKFFTPNSNQTHRKNSIGFTYNIYIDNIGTTQPTGSFWAEIQRVGLMHENDMWGEPRTDKFRTAGIKLHFRTKDFQYSANVILWHGDAFHYRVFKYDNTNYPSRFGYKDLSEATFGKFSVGIFSVQADYALPYNQVVSASTGIDAEQVRHATQNVAVHDMWILPEKFIGYKLKHYPMLTNNGEPYTFDKNSKKKVRKPKFYFNFALNPSLFY